jgi:hypothetical protein
MTTRVFRSRRGRLQVRCYGSDRGGAVAIVSDLTGGLTNQDHEFRAEDKPAALRLGREFAHKILSHNPTIGGRALPVTEMKK